MKTLREVLEEGRGDHLRRFVRLWFYNNPPVKEVMDKSERHYKVNTWVSSPLERILDTPINEVMDKLSQESLTGDNTFDFDWCDEVVIKDFIKRKVKENELDPRDKWSKDIEEWYQQFRDDVPSYEWTHTCENGNKAYRITVKYDSSRAVDELRKLHSRTPEGCSMEVKLEHRVCW